MDITTRTPASLWIVGVLALLWNLLGLASFVFQMLMPAEALQAMPAEQRAVYEAAPGWLYLFYGIATIGGVLGSLALLLRRRWAALVFLVALLGLIVQVIAGYATTPSWAVSGAAGLGFSLFLVLVAVALWRFSAWMEKRGVLR